MEAVEFRCPWCAEMARIPLDDLVVCEEPASLLVECPICRRTGAVEINEEIVETLQLLGVPVASAQERSRAVHPAGRRFPREVQPRTHEGPPLSWDDLLDFHLLLQQDDWFDQLVALVG